MKEKGQVRFMLKTPDMKWNYQYSDPGQSLRIVPRSPETTKKKWSLRLAKLLARLRKSNPGIPWFRRSFSVGSP
jgi:hypothetical protein